MSRLPMMPWYPADFAGSTSAWTLVERALYRELLDAQWLNGALPSDPRRLARIARVDNSEFESAWLLVQTKFALVDGCFVNQRLEEHRTKSLELHEQRLAAARASAQARGERALQRSLNERSSGRSTSGETLVLHPSPSPELSSDSSPKPNRQKNPSARPNGKSLDWFPDFRAIYPPRAGSQAWPRAERAAHARLAEGHTPTEMLDGARRYAAFVEATGKARTEYVQQAATFLGPSKHFLEPWEPPQTPLAAVVAAERARRPRKSTAELEAEAKAQGIDTWAIRPQT